MKLAQGGKRNHITLAKEVALDHLFIAVVQILGGHSSSLKQYSILKGEKKNPNAE